jgi:hypothetical protein
VSRESVADAIAVYPGDTPPRPLIELQDAGTTFRVGQSFTATDSLGLSRTVIRRLVPRTVNVRFETGPINLKLDINGYTSLAPEVFTSWEG